MSGHVLHAVAGKIDHFVYDSVYLRYAQSEHYLAVQMAGDQGPKELRKHEELCATLYARALFRAGDDAEGTKLYDWCLSFVRLKSPAAVAEVDRCQADSKFFRSQIFVMLAAIVIGIRQCHLMAATVSALHLALLCSSLGCDQTRL